MNRGGESADISFTMKGINKPFSIPLPRRIFYAPERLNPDVVQTFGAGPIFCFCSSIFRAVLAFSNPHIVLIMLRLEKAARDPENTALKTPASKNLCNIRVK
jgi:hypothetical protein